MLILSGCGTTSGLRNAKNSNQKLDLSSYNTVIVNDFGDGISSTSDDQKVLSEGRRFADMIASGLKSKNVFSKVERNVYSTNNALLIDGKITEYEEGNSTKRMLIGFGAGSSKFDARVYARDNKSKEILGDLNVDLNSWALGGAIAASQDCNSHMNSAASSIVKEVVIAKKATK